MTGKARLGNVPLPEPYLLGIAASAGLSRVRPWALPGSPLTHRLAGAPLIAAGTIVIARSLQAAGQVDLDHPRRLVTTGPYAASRNPMYVGWALLHLGAAVAGGSVWMLAAFAATGQVHRQILGEERELGDRFGDEFGRYRAAVPRYLPRWPRKGHRPTRSPGTPRSYSRVRCTDHETRWRSAASRRAERRIFAILSALDWALGCAQISQLRRSSSASRAADYESSILANAQGKLYLRKREAARRCRPRLDRVFAVIMI